MKMKKTMVATLSVVALAFAGTAQADAPRQAGSSAMTGTRGIAQSQTTPTLEVPTDAQAALATVERFGSALQAGDLNTVEALLDPEVLILESGGAERNRQQYFEHHAAADAKFLGSANIRLVHRTARRSGDLVWIGSESEIHAQKGEKPLTLLSTETMILKRIGEEWRIVHIHWSSRPRT